MTKRPYLHALLYGDTGVGKTTFASTFPKPMLVFQFDHNGKDMPYMKGGEVQKGEDGNELQSYEIETGRGDITITHRDVMYPDGIVRIEYYNRTDDIDNPTAFSYFRTRMGILHEEYDLWKTVVVDSITFMALQARKLEEKVLNPLPQGVTLYTKGGGGDQRMWFAGATSSLEELLCMRLAGLDMNVVAIAHVSRDKNMLSGEIVQVPSAPGRLSSMSLLSAAFAEQYRLYTKRNAEGYREYWAQTSNRDQYAAATQIEADDPVYPHYASLWTGWDKLYGKQSKKEA